MDEEKQRILDEEHLRLLRIGWLISAAMNLFWCFFPLLYIGIGLFVLFGPNGGPPRGVGVLFAVLGATLAFVMTVITTLKFLTARAIGQRRGRVLCFVTAAVTCLAMPYGTALGVCTFLVLLRPSVRAQFVP